MVFGRIIDLRNNTTSDILVEDIGIVLPLNANATTTNVVRITDFISVDEINFSGDLETLLTSGDVSVNGTNGGGDGTAADNLTLADATNEVTLTTATAAQEVAGATTIVKAADETVNNTSTVQADDDFVFAVETNSVYLWEMTLLLESAATNSDYKCAWNVPVGTTMLWGPHNQAGNRYWETANTGVAGDALLTEASIFSWGSQAAIQGTHFRGFIFTGGNAGNVAFEWAQDTAQVTDTSILQDSTWIIRKIR